MRRVGTVFVFVLVVSGFQSRPITAQQAVIGHWTGVASREGVYLPIEFSFADDGTGTKGSITIPTMGALNFPLNRVSFEAPRLSFELRPDSDAFNFEGTLSDNSLTGSWDLFGFESQVSMQRTVAARTPYVEEGVSCRNQDVTLSGTLLVPASQGPHPVLIFLHGSGAAVRQSNNFLADHFARRGIASLIFDKRGSGASTGDWREANFNDLAQDVLACVQVVKDRGDIDPRMIGLIGGSQAGWIGPLAASLSQDVAFLIMISGPTVTVAREGWWDREFRLREHGFTESEIEQAVLLLKMNDEVTRTGQGLAKLEAEIDRVRGERWFAAFGFEAPPPIDAPFRQFYRRIIDFNPGPILDRTTVPSLWIYGGRDESMPAQESAKILAELKMRGKDISVITFPEADHALFVKSHQDQPFRWPSRVPGYLDAMTDWVQRQVIRR